MNILGQSKAHWAMMVLGYICVIPVFLQVGIILLTPLMFSIVKESKLPLIQVGMALVVALTTVHCIVPPHPAAMAVTDLLKADVGKVIFFGLLVGLPAASIAGPIYGKFIAKRLPAVPLTGVYANTEPRKESELPPFGSSLFIMLLPLLLTLLCCGGSVSMFIITAYVGRREEDGLFVFFVFFFAGLFTLAPLVRGGKGLTRRDLLLGALVGVPNFCASRLLLAALTRLPAFVVYPCYSVGAILVISLCSVLLFHERLSRRQWGAEGMILAAAALLNL